MSDAAHPVARGAPSGRLAPHGFDRATSSAKERAACGWSRRRLLILGLSARDRHGQRRGRQTHVNHRLIADLHTWRAYTRPRLPQPVGRTGPARIHTTHDVVCGNTTPGPPKQRIQLCLLMSGPVITAGAPRTAAGTCRRKVEDAPRLRYGCFGAASRAGKAARAERRGSLAEAPSGASPAGHRHARAPLVAAGGAGRCWPRRCGFVDARPAELLVRRGVHAGARAAPACRRRFTRWCTPRTRRRSGTCSLGGSRVFGTGAVALRLPSALAGVATVRVVWAIGASSEAAARRVISALCRGQSAVRLVLPGGARLCPVRAHHRAGDAVLPARRARPDARAWPHWRSPARWRC